MSGLVPAKNSLPESEYPATEQLIADLRGLIESARTRVAVAANREQTLLYWDLGQRIREDILHEKRAPYGKQIVSTVSRQLIEDYGSGYSRQNLFRMMQTVEYFPDRAMVDKVAAVVQWSHFVEVLPLRDPLEREFYISMCHACRWSIRGLRREIAGALFTRTALSRNTDELVRQELAALRDEDRWTPDLVLRDPYILPFLGLADTYSEKDLETAILRQLQAFLLELGVGFTFVARQQRIVIGGKSHQIDLLFYHRKLKRLVVIELKIGPFEAAHKGQLELYMSWLNKNEREPGEESPIGIILCTEASQEEIELLQIGKDDIHVAEYITQNLPPALLVRKLKEAEERGRAQLAARQQPVSEGEQE
ncbi:PDDEXK nuclease domain-containing protein [Armatimonas sp.]|uniref:PDDEXK nuclease domain-containing protein n=1 Tax=Armatimonas sp. TaxID=1872638 RepID=UPI00286D33C9|nr:PDDEXK nuclease domain-containing protein [Armatimonas sp.]